MSFSAFEPLDLLELSGDVPLAERLYDAMAGWYGDQYDLTVGASRQEAFTFAEAIQNARVMRAMERASRQRLLSDLDELLPEREAEYQITPGLNDTIADRKAELGRRMKRGPVADRSGPKAWTAQAITDALRERLGDDFIAYRPTPLDEAEVWPPGIGNNPMNLQRPGVVRKIIRTLDYVVDNMGGPSTVRFEMVATPQGASTSNSSSLEAGDSIVVDAGIEGICETTSVDTVNDVDGTFTAIFELPHEAGTLAFTHPYPRWHSSKRFSLVVLTPEAAADPEKRRVANWMMRRMVRGASRWAVVQSEDGLTTGDFIAGESIAGIQTIQSAEI